jgi:hypothetical protein
MGRPLESPALLAITARVFAWSLAIGWSLTLGCGARHKDVFCLDDADAGQTVIAAVGDTIELKLSTIGPGEHGTPVVSSGSVVFTGESPAGPPAPLGPTRLYRFKAVASGQADITVPHTRDRPPEAAILDFSITVQVL